MVGRLEISRQADRAEPIGLALTFELAGPEDLGRGEAYAPVDDDNPDLSVPDQQVFIDAVAAGESIAVEENVVGDATALDAGERIPGETRSFFHGRETAERRTNKGWAIIDVKFLSDPQDGPSRLIGRR